MKHEIRMSEGEEQEGEGDEGVLVTWFVEPGALVEIGALIAEVQVEKAATEVLAPVTGKVLELCVDAGGVVTPGAVLAVIDDAAATAGVASQTQAAAPPARHLDSTPATATDAARMPAAVARSEPISHMRRQIADRMKTWQSETAQLTITTDANVTRLMSELPIATGASGRRSSLLSAVLRACALSLRVHPRLAARWTGDALALAESLDIAVAVAVDDGLVTPVVDAADTRSVANLDQEISALAQRARGSGLAAEEMRGGVFTISNLGAYGIDAFTPLLNPPQSAILGIGRAKPTAAVVDGGLGIQTRMVLSLTFDHRVVDGVPAAAFLRDVVANLEEPSRLLGEE